MTNAAAQPHHRRAVRRAEQAGRALVTSEQAPVTAKPAAGSHRWVSRAVVLAAVAALTIVGPLAGANATTPTPQASPAAVAQTPADSVIADLATGAVELPEASDLDADPDAATRAISTASRGHVREAIECPVQTEANGALGAAMGGQEVAAPLVMPAAEGTYRLTSGYGPRTYPFPGMHEGTDFAGSLGTPLYAVTDGTVIYSGGGKNGRSGQIVIIRAEVDGATYDFWYGHMFTSGVLVSEGETVTVGQKIAEIGNNGNSTGPHLHFEVHDANDQTQDPYAFLKAHGAQPVGSVATCA
jgi:murein DD-endopeptidase MepM/ murein hydrolase activator NlpD